MRGIDMSALAPNAVILLVAPLFFVGIIGKVKGLWAGRRGPRLTQPFLDVGKLLGKGEVLSTTTSAVFRIAPSVELASALCAAALVPMAGGRAMLSFEGDLVLFAYLLAAGRFIGALAALDTGSSFAGMGSAREVLFSALAEPAFFLAVGTLALFGGTASFASLFAALGSGDAWSWTAVGLCAAALFLVLLVEGSRLPVDDPATHLELTMVHEAMILDYSGPDLAFIQCATAVKMLSFAGLAAGMVAGAAGSGAGRTSFSPPRSLPRRSRSAP